MEFYYLLETVSNNVYIIYSITRNKSICSFILIYEEQGKGAFYKV